MSPTTPPTGLAVAGVVKTYAGAAALGPIDLMLRPGVIYGLFGRNGAGKSTLLGCLAGRLLPDRGTMSLDGVDLRASEDAQSRVYLVNDTLPFLVATSIRSFFRNEERFAGGFDWGFATRMLMEAGIDPASRFHQLPLGRRMMVRLAAALAVPAEVLLLDEPMLGLDAVNRSLFHRLVLEAVAERPRTIVMATHLIDEVAPVIERAIVLDHGRVADECAVDSVDRGSLRLQDHVVRLMAGGVATTPEPGNAVASDKEG
ncbi:ABC transporter ATP-binding protein [Bifidobacterium pullorum subsp. saeculare]|uniref:ABC transporter ATP-binding protein n=1 Tax=Bifidobacterium pullorum subsp. saeculare TaxID=78257 RepID=A0A939B8V8_9BIFI|nr:ABC transporter ATP-binding protein [Bifidobacterium pullorum]MBM6698779.1 ABC transporter ATP-binding protein [Bifidobacterium pullorum subsp. saeculare]